MQKRYYIAVAYINFLVQLFLWEVNFKQFHRHRVKMKVARIGAVLPKGKNLYDFPWCFRWKLGGLPKDLKYLPLVLTSWKSMQPPPTETSSFYKGQQNIAENIHIPKVVYQLTVSCNAKSSKNWHNYLQIKFSCDFYVFYPTYPNPTLDTFVRKWESKYGVHYLTRWVWGWKVSQQLQNCP